MAIRFLAAVLGSCTLGRRTGVEGTASRTTRGVVGAVVGRTLEGPAVDGAEPGRLPCAGMDVRCGVEVRGRTVLAGGIIRDCDWDRVKLGFGSNDVDGTRDTDGVGIPDEPMGGAGIREGFGACASAFAEPGKGMTFCELVDGPKGVLCTEGLKNPGAFRPEGSLI